MPSSRRTSMLVVVGCLVATGATAPLAQARKMAITHTTSLAPVAASRHLGVKHTLTAQVMSHSQNCDPDGPFAQPAPHPSTKVKFSVTAGPNKGKAGTAVTNAQGKATFTYTSTKTGTDTLIARPVWLKNTGVCNPDAGPAAPSDEAEVTWLPPKLSIGDAEVVEGDGGVWPPTLVKLTVSLSAPSSDPVTVDYASGHGSAQGKDYLAKAGSLTFQPGNPLTRQIGYFVVGDLLCEADEWFKVVLLNPINAQLADGKGIVTVHDDDHDR